MTTRAGNAPFAGFKAAELPTHNDEAWRFTNLNKLRERGDISIVAQSPQQTPWPDGVRRVNLADDTEMASMLDDPRIEEHPVAHLTLAALSSGFGIRISGQVEAPINLVFDTDGDDLSVCSAGVILLEDGASATIFERHTGSGIGLSAPLLAVKIGAGARLHHARVQVEGLERHHLSQLFMTIEQGGVYHALAVQSGGILARSESHIALVGENVDMAMTSIYLAQGEQVSDVTSRVEHRVPNCRSMQIVRGVLDDQARGVFQGKVIVAQDAQKTDGNQMSRALLLSRKCEADAKPELEIYADDVVCSHGATVGEIDDDQLFYLMSRGVPPAQARQILIEAFLADVLAEVEDRALVEFAKGAVTDWLEGGHDGN